MDMARLNNSFSFFHRHETIKSLLKLLAWIAGGTIVFITGAWWWVLPIFIFVLAIWIHNTSPGSKIDDAVEE
jgi:hypothetical protein